MQNLAKLINGHNEGIIIPSDLWVGIVTNEHPMEGIEYADKDVPKNGFEIHAVFEDRHGDKKIVKHMVKSSDFETISLAREAALKGLISKMVSIIYQFDGDIIPK